MSKPLKDITEIEPHEIQLYWQPDKWQPLEGYILYYSPNGEYKALVNDTMQGIAMIISRNKIEKYDGTYLYDLVSKLGGWI